MAECRHGILSIVVMPVGEERLPLLESAQRDVPWCAVVHHSGPQGFVMSMGEEQEFRGGFSSHHLANQVHTQSSACSQ
jgi:hypothetical protein